MTYINNDFGAERESPLSHEVWQSGAGSFREYFLSEKCFSDETAAELGELQPDDEIFELLSYDLMRKHKIMPIGYDENGVLTVVAGDPMNCHAISALASRFNGRYKLIRGMPSDIIRYVDAAEASTRMELALNGLNDISPTHKSSVLTIADTTDTDNIVNSPAVRLVDSIIKEAIAQRASDIHIEPFDESVRVRYRIDGDLYVRAEFVAESYSAVCARLKIMAGMDIAERRMPQDGRIGMTVCGVEYDLRVSTLPTAFGEKIVIRILDGVSFRYAREQLGFTEAENAAVDKMLSRPHGMILLTGPTGCGKSTTLYSFLSELNDQSVSIVTVEDPIEYRIRGICQTEVNTKTNLTFVTALRSILRQDPDVIMIGEIRDEVTAEIAVRSAITGHLVFSTLHTNDAPGALIRLTDMGIEKYLAAEAVVGVIAQRLVKKLCPRCKREHITTSEEMKILGICEPIVIYEPCGCRHCNGTGYRERTAVHEILCMNAELRETFLKEPNLDALRRLASESGMTSLADSCRALVLRGVTSIRELLRLSVD